MTCPLCGGANPDGAAFCAHCGRSLQAAPQQPPPQTPSAAPTDIGATQSFPPPVPPAVPADTCLVCGAVLGPLDNACPRCKTPRGMRVNPASPIPGAYTQAAGWQFVNTSGQQGDVPVEIRGGWNWGAFWFSWIWGLNHKTPITFLTLPCTVLSLIPYVGWLFSLAGLGCRIWFGIKGNEWAWQNRRFESVEHCRTVQRIWAYWALGLFLAEVVLGLLFFAAIGAMIAAATSSGGGPRPFGP